MKICIANLYNEKPLSAFYSEKQFKCKLLLENIISLGAVYIRLFVLHTYFRHLAFHSFLFD